MKHCPGDVGGSSLGCSTPACRPCTAPRPAPGWNRVPGPAATLVAQAQVRSGDVGIIFANSGVNAFPVEIGDELML